MSRQRGSAFSERVELGAAQLKEFWFLPSIPDVRTAHSVAGLEVDSCAGDDLSTAWMIGRLDADDLGCKAGVMLVHNLKNSSFAEEGSRLLTPFGMAVHMTLQREDCVQVCGLRMDVKDARFVVVNPDDGRAS